MRYQLSALRPFPLDEAGFPLSTISVIAADLFLSPTIRRFTVLQCSLDG